MYRFSVIDNGDGIEAKHHHLIFQAFKQVPKKVEFAHSTGLGLNICKKIIHILGGEIGFHSDGLNCGSEFYFEIPLATSNSVWPASPDARRRSRLFKMSREPTANGWISDSSGNPTNTNSGGLPFVLASVNSSGMPVISSPASRPRRNTREGNNASSKSIGSKSMGSGMPYVVASVDSSGMPIIASPARRNSPREADRATSKLDVIPDVETDTEVSATMSLYFGPKLSLYADQFRVADLLLPVNPMSLRILVTDDSAITRKLLCRSMKIKYGLHSIQQASHGGEAVEKCSMRTTSNEPQFNVIFMDYNMPTMNGIECIKKLRGNGVNSLIVGLTGNAMDDDKQEMIDAGADVVLTKPIEARSVLQILSTASKIFDQKSGLGGTVR